MVYVVYGTDPIEDIVIEGVYSDRVTAEGYKVKLNNKAPELINEKQIKYDVAYIMLDKPPEGMSFR